MKLEELIIKDCFRKRLSLGKTRKGNTGGIFSYDGSWGRVIPKLKKIKLRRSRGFEQALKDLKSSRQT